jgi:hypothetical protein
MTVDEMEQRFQDYSARIERILNLFDDRGRISRERTEEAQSMFRALKRRLAGRVYPTFPF